MNARLQTAGLGLYRCLRLSGLLCTEPGRRLFEFCYDRYKAWGEARDIRVLAMFITPGTSVVDVGANIGFFTRRFASWVSKGGRVLAIEPEPVTFERLTYMVVRRRLEHVVEPIRVAAVDHVGMVNLFVDPFHPAGHRIAAQGISVPATTVDQLLEERDWPRVALIKIDVQGAEMRVLRGARECMSRFHPALFVEVDEEALKSMGTDVGCVLQFAPQFGYQPHHIDCGKPRLLTDRHQIDACLRHRYTDLLFLVEGAMRTP